MKEIIKYQADDGTIFDTEEDCVEYEDLCFILPLRGKVRFYYKNNLEMVKENPRISFTFYEKEYEITKQDVTRTQSYSERNKIVWGTIQRNLGIADFHIGGSYDNDIGKLYNEYREKLLELLK